MKTKTLLATLLTTWMLPAALLADGPLPLDPKVVAGDVAIARPSAQQMVITQVGAAGIVNWDSFSIAAGHGVTVNNGSGATLNRVTGGDVSSIFGALDATGSVYLVNQNGIVFGETGVVNTGGTFVASALDIGNDDFLAGGDDVFAGSSDAYVINLGRISSLGGDVALMGRNVVNEGTITAPDGTVGLVAGREILMRDASVDDGMFAVRIGGADSSVTEAGAIRAAAAELRANGGNVYALAGNTSGTIAATGVAKVKGRVFLTAGDTGRVKVEKTVKARAADGRGGQITVNGGNVEMAGLLDASGRAGGEVRLNSAIETVFTGTVLAYGDGSAGTGGFVEVSGRKLSFGGTVETRGGAVLIDPTNIEISNSTGAFLSGATLLTPSLIVGLLATQDVIINTAGSGSDAGTIVVSNAINWDSNFSLSLLAQGDIWFNASVQGSNATGGDLNVVAGWDASTSTTVFDATPFINADLATQTLFGNVNGASYDLSGTTFNAVGNVYIRQAAQSVTTAVGALAGTTRVFGGSMLFGSGGEGFTQLGYNTASSGISATITGDIVVRSRGLIWLSGGNVAGSASQIGHGGMFFSPTAAPTATISGDISVEAIENVILDGGKARNSYAMIGHGSRDTGNSLQATGDRSGSVTVSSLREFSIAIAENGATSAGWIGHATRAGTISAADISISSRTYDQDALTSGGGGNILDIGMLAENVLGGTVTVASTSTSFGSALTLTGTTEGINCRCNFINTANNLVVAAQGDLILDPTFFFSNRGLGNVALAAGRNFINNAGAGAFGTMGGRWLIYSQRPDANVGDINVLRARFLEYGMAFDPTAPFDSSGIGNGFVYAVQPVIEVADAQITYGETLTLPGLQMTVGGTVVDAAAFGLSLDSSFLDRRQVTFSGSGFVNAGTYATALGANVSIAADPATRVRGLITDFGQLTVDPVTLTGSIIGTPTKVYDGSIVALLSPANFLLSGFVSGEGATVTQTLGSYDADNASATNLVIAVLAAGDFVANSGTVLANYVLPTTVSGNGVINRVTLTGSIIGTPTKVYDGSLAAVLDSANFLLTGFAAFEGATVTQTSGTYASATASGSNLVTAVLAAGDFVPTGTTLLANYILPTSVSGNGVISQAATVTGSIIGTPTKVYDGSAAAVLTSANFLLSGFVAGEGATVTQTVGTYASVNASGTNLVTAVLAAGDFVANSGTVLANYVLPTTVSGNGVISQAATVTGSIIGTPTKVYDGSAAAVLTSANFLLSGFVAGEGATVTQTSGTYASVNASGTNLVTAVLAAGDFVANSGTVLANYVLPTTVSGNGVITQAATVTGAIIGTPTKVYDGSAAAVLTSANFLLSGFVAGEGATVTQTSGTYASVNASGTNLVTAVLAAGDFVATGTTVLANYVLPTTVSGNGVISQAATVTGSIIGTPTKVYDGSAAAVLTSANFLLSGFVAGEGATVTQTAGTYASVNASGTNLVTAVLAAGDFVANSGTVLANYVLPTTVSGNGVIAQAATVTGAIIGTPTKVYDGSAAAVLTSANFLLSGFVAGEGATVTQTAGTYASVNASGTNLVTAVLAAGDFVANSGTVLANYVLPTTVSGNGVISQAATVTGAIIGTPTKVYDGSAAAVLTSANFLLSGFVAGEGATVTQTAGTYASVNASGTNLVTAVLAAGDFVANSGTVLANYVLPTTVSGNGVISQAATVTGAIIGTPTKVYDGSAAAVLTSANFLLSGFVAGEGATVTQTAGTYASVNASGTNLVTAVLAAGDFVANSGTVLANYVLPTTVSGNGVISQAATVTGAIIGTPTKVYDGSAAAVLTSANFLLSGFVAGEGATVTQTAGTYASVNASGTNLVTAVLAAGDFVANSGTVLANYVLPTTVSGNGVISQAATVTGAIIGTPTKVYDGSAAAVLTSANFLLSGFVAGEGATVTQTAGTYASVNASGTNLVTAVLAAGDFVANSGTVLANYVLPTTVSGNGVISQAATVTGAIIGTPTKVYDGSAAAVLTSANFLLSGFVAGEGATVTQTAGTYASVNASGTNLVTAVLAAGDFVANSGTVLANYVLPTTVSGNGVINRAQLVVSLVGLPTKPFDGTSVATLTSANFLLSGFVGGEGATIRQTSGTYSFAAVGDGNSVTADLTAASFDPEAGTLLSNYILPDVATGEGLVDTAPAPQPQIPETRGLETFDTTPLGEPSGPAVGLEIISTETTQRIMDEINAGSSFCKSLVNQEFVIDCLSDRLQAVADGLSAVGEYAEVRAALEDAAQKLQALALANASADLARQVARAGGQRSSRALTAISTAALGAANAQAAAIIDGARLVLLRSSSGSEQRSVAFAQVAQVVNSTKVLLRSS